MRNKALFALALIGLGVQLIRAQVTEERLLGADRDSANWLMYAKDYTSQRFSRLNQINTANVKRLVPQWVFQTKVLGKHECAPLVVDGIIYITAPSNHAFALDARTGRQIWHYQRALPERQGLCCGPVNRGFAMLGNKLFMATIDAHLVALDAKTGNVIWDVEMADYREGYSATVAPLVVKNKVIAGIAGADFGTRGFIDAYDAETGKRVWRFWTVPAPGEPGSETWEGESWAKGGGSAWVTGSYDPELNLLYWGTGNPGPDIFGDIRKGDNLYTDCMVALDPDTGKMKWYYQFTPHDVHDWDGVNEPVLIDVVIDNKPRKLLIQANRNGFFYAIDRTNGKLLYGKPFVRTTWAKEIGPDGRPIRLPGNNPTPEGTRVCPGLGGGKNWFPMAYSPETGLAYVPSIEACQRFRLGEPVFIQGQQYLGSVFENIPNERTWGALKAIDVRTGKIRWEFETVSPLGAGVLATAGGLVFTGDPEGYMIAFDAQTGKVLWRFQTGGSITAPPITYLLEGKQQIAVFAGTALFTFALP